MEELKVTSSAFRNRMPIPKKYTCDGDNVNPPLKVENVPAGAKSLVLIMDDPDAPMGTWVHWLVWNMHINREVKENSVPGTEGINSAKDRSYGGPCPPSGTHRYFFKVYALDRNLEISESSKKEDLEKAIDGHVLAKGELVGIYTHSR
jgi:Raf kinase inhibitor-like YbhB/YbcL family protein